MQINQERNVDNDEALDEYERELHNAIARIQQEYQRAIEPYVKRLVELHNIRPRRIEIPLEQARSLGLIS